jgi:neutral amino acid transport system permease protein
MDWFEIFLQILTQTGRSAIGTDAVVYALIAIGLNIHFGYTGLLNFGQAAFAAMGAYGVAIGVSTFNLPFGVSLLLGIAGAVVLALLLGIPTLRLRADYLAIVTIAAAEIVRLTFKAVEWADITGGTDGIQNFAGTFYELNPYPPGSYGIGALSFDNRVFWVLTVGWVLVGLTTGMVYLLMKSPWGRVLKAIREDEDAVRSLGKNVFSYKMQSLVLGGVVGCLAGFIFALARSSVQPDNYSPDFTFFAYAIVILGGAARVLSPTVGAMIFWVLLVFVGETLDALVAAQAIPTWIMDNVQVGSVRFMIVGLGLMLLVVFRPQGIFGDKREISLDAR